MQRLFTVYFCVLLAGLAHADEAKPLPPIKPIPRLLPPPGVEIPKEERAKLEARLATVIKAIDDAKVDKDLKPDIQIYTKAVHWALDFDEFYDAKKDVAKAHAALDSAEKRLEAVRSGKPLWPAARGLLTRGYVSEIDDSVQPYGLHIPEKLDLTKPVPLLVWLHGRGDKETDLHFIATREKNKGEFAPDWCITLHPYGRGTIGFKFAGEIDVLDAIESVKKRYKIDDDRIALAGFSMGGAGAWHIGAHYADRFCVVHAGAGFVETAKYNKLTPDKYPSWYEQKLWGWYDVPCYTRNLFNVPVIAYSGENDKQKQAADLMAEAFKAEGRELRHIIGPGVEHKYEAKAKEQVLAEIKAAVDKGRDRWPKKVSVQTRTLRYGFVHWVGLLRQMEQGVDTRIEASSVAPNRIEVVTKNVVAFRLSAPWKEGPKGKVTVVVDGQALEAPAAEFEEILIRRAGRWVQVPHIGRDPDVWSLSDKDPIRGGPIDEAFMPGVKVELLVVLPSKPARNESVQRWVEFESRHFVERWRALFRGDLRVKRDVDVTEADLSDYNLVLWGDPQSNSVIAKMLPTLPLKWDKVLQVGDRSFDAANHVPVMVRPVGNVRYIVLNSGPTFREGHDRTNSQQTPKLPDWAIIGLDKDPDAFAPGEIKAAGFFDENWKVKAEEKK